MKRTFRKTTNKKWYQKINLYGLPFYFVIVFLILIPILLVFLTSIQKSNTVNDFDFTLSHYFNFFKEPAFIKAMGRSLYVASLTTIFSLIIAYPLAYIIAMSNKKIQALLIILVTSPMWINLLIRVKALQQILLMINPKLPNHTFSLILGMVYTFLPYMVLPIYTILSKIDHSLFESSHDLGANKFKTFIRVTLPLSMPGVLSGIIMTFLPAATTLVIPNYLGDGSYLIGNIIERSIVVKLYGGFGYGAAISMILALIIMGLVIIMKRLDKSGGLSDEK